MSHRVFIAIGYSTLSEGAGQRVFPAPVRAILISMECDVDEAIGLLFSFGNDLNHISVAKHFTELT